MPPRWLAKPQLPHASVVLISAISLGLGGCTSTLSTANDAETLETSNDLQVLTTFLPITQFTKAVVGDRAEVMQLMPTDVEPHAYQAKPADAQAIANADVLVKNGLEMEFFLEDLIANVGNADLVVVDSSAGIETFEIEEEELSVAHIEGDEHDHGHADDDIHSEGEAHLEDDHHHHGEFDPHIWLDPKRAIQQVKNIRDGLIAIDPDGESEYIANAAAYIKQLEALDQEITERLAPYAGQTFISFHDFAFYFADSYNLNADHLIDLPQESPSPEDVRRIIETTKSENIKALLTEPQAEVRIFESLAYDMGIALSIFDPIAVGDQTATEPEYYLTIMRQNLKSLEAAFGDDE